MACGRRLTRLSSSNPRVNHEEDDAGRMSFPEWVTAEVRDLISGLCQADLSRRLGNMAEGAAGVKAHPWFTGVDWTALYNREIQSPYRPNVKGPGDAANFDKYPEEKIQGLPPTEDVHRDLFAGF